MIALALASTLLIGVTSPVDDAAPEVRPAPAVRWFVILERGQPAAPLTREEAAPMQDVHLKNLGRLYLEGKSPIAGPLGDGGRLRGIVIVDAPDRAALDREFEPDPFVEHRHLVVHAMQMHEPHGSLGKAAEPFEIGAHSIAFLYADEDLADDRKVGLVSAARAKLLRAAADGGGPDLTYGGPLLGDEDVVGVFLFREEDVSKVRAAVDASIGEDAPITAKVYAQYCGKGILDAPAPPPSNPAPAIGVDGEAGSESPAPTGGG